MGKIELEIKLRSPVVKSTIHTLVYATRVLFAAGDVITSLKELPCEPPMYDSECLPHKANSSKRHNPLTLLSYSTVSHVICAASGCLHEVVRA